MTSPRPADTGSRARLTPVLVVALLPACATTEPTASQASPKASVVASADPTESPAALHVPAAAIDEELRGELLAMMAEDQAVRTGQAPPGDNRTPEELVAAMNSVDAANARRMTEILDEFGWPGWSLVGEDGALAAWVLVQHADLDLDLQKRGLALLEAAVAADDASPGDLAYLVDRVRVAEGRPQVYGTQIGAADENGDPTPRTPIEDPENVDARRAAAGLGTLEEYYDEMRRMLEKEQP
jgi:hypothetical protein